MPVTDVIQDVDSRSLTIIAEFAAPPSRVWQLYADPRQLEQIWGPVGYPATVVDHDLTPGGKVTYYMTSPEGEKFCGYWLVDAVDEPDRLDFRDGFADEDFVPNDVMPLATNVYTFVASDTDAGQPGTLATYVTTFDTVEALQKVLEMDVIEGATSAISQIDAVLAG
ncbi:SRPBCC domain-containing protein [Gordonia jinhuaensis]|uniref:Activator of HSP90 ATPase n=1 Tax=Gordonia jinhuaensis TaxID=1517702 RepID=A0A916WX38_9ACTN|nr:SRPBCC domain-containing protein [Gordonia jinhuaensis]GGB37380.1 activator of HSP90 ATPase [Gordonia jinhuaensis]